nr:tRNA (adenosine(37)-N6)-dimethylallyltransferase MiaA [Glaciecola sp. MH2013]
MSLMGPTASGKTALAIELAKRIDGEVISVDSALIYKGMDIGTAKPDSAEMRGVKHWLIDIIEPHEVYSVAEFRRDAVACIEDIVSRGKVPILAGGTMMYFNALIKGLSPLPNANAELRKDIQEMIDRDGLQAAHQYLASFDAQSAQRIHENDPQRIMRAIEVYRLTGKTMTFLQSVKPPQLPYEFIQFSLMPSQREHLHERIAQRFDQMLQNKFEQEVEALCKDTRLHADLPSIRSVGYRQMWQYLHGEYGEGEKAHSEMREKGIIATRQLAKRQITWLRSWDGATELLTGDEQNMNLILHRIS